MESPSLKCKKCFILIPEGIEDQDNLCDNCNVGLIAQNLVAELSQHKIRTEASGIDETDERSLPEEGPSNASSKGAEAAPPGAKSEEVEKEEGGESLARERESINSKDSVEDAEDEKSETESNKEAEVQESERKIEIRIEPMKTRAKQSLVEVKQEAMEEDEEKGADMDDGDDDDDLKGPMMRRLTRKTLAEIEKYKHPIYESSQTKNRRSKIFKSKQVYKAPTSQARIYTSDYVFHKGTYYQVGDIVATKDTYRPGIFYAQITSFLTDQYCFKCATIQWLFPTKESPKPEKGFDPRTYFLGFIDETPRPLDCLLPVMHCPSDYYKFYRSPYPPPNPHPFTKHVLWKRVGPISLDELISP